MMNCSEKVRIYGEAVEIRKKEKIFTVILEIGGGAKI